MVKDKKLEYLKLILRTNGVKWTGKYYSKDKKELCTAKTFDEVACYGKNGQSVEIEIKDDVWNRYILSVNKKLLEVVRYDVEDTCILNVTPIFKLGKAWEKAFKKATEVTVD